VTEINKALGDENGYESQSGSVVENPSEGEIDKLNCEKLQKMLRFDTSRQRFAISLRQLAH
jgi:hypothetical protein